MRNRQINSKKGVSILFILTFWCLVCVPQRVQAQESKDFPSAFELALAFTETNTEEASYLLNQKHKVVATATAQDCIIRKLSALEVCTKRDSLNPISRVDATSTTNPSGRLYKKEDYQAPSIILPVE